MNEPILSFLAIDVLALMLLGLFAGVLPPAVCASTVAACGGLGMLLCLLSLLATAPAVVLPLAIGPPGLPSHLALDPLSAFFLLSVFLAGAAIAAFEITSIPKTDPAPARTTAFCLAGTSLTLLSADGIVLSVGLAVTSAAIWFPRTVKRNHAPLLTPVFLLLAVCLLTPAGFDPRFAAIRAAPIETVRAFGAATLTIAGVACLVWTRSEERSWSRFALTAGLLMPTGPYLLLRVMVDLLGGRAQGGWGFVLILIGGGVGVVAGWRAAQHPDADVCATWLTQRQIGLATAGVGLAIIARAADLPEATFLALAAALFLVLGGSSSGVLASLAIHVIGTGAGTHRPSRLGGLVHSMPASSAAVAAGLLGLVALPPGPGFVSLWLMFEAILAAPRTGGLLFQLPIALLCGALALSAALASTAVLRLIGIALLGRPRSPRGAGAQESTSGSRTLFLILGAVSFIIGVLPGPVLRLLAVSPIRALTGSPSGVHLATMSLRPAFSAPGYGALPLLALLVLMIGGAISVSRWFGRGSKLGGIWTDGMQPPVGLPFGEPAAQSMGDGFLPPLPEVSVLPRLPRLAALRRPPAAMGLWLVLAVVTAALLLLAVVR